MLPLLVPGPFCLDSVSISDEEGGKGGVVVLEQIPNIVRSKCGWYWEGVDVNVVYVVFVMNAGVFA